MELSEIITLAGLALAGVISHVRLEGRVNQAEKSNEQTDKKVDSLTIKHEALDSKVLEQIAQMRESLARIEGWLQRDDEK